MASIFKRRDSKTGKPVGKWQITYFDPSGRRVNRSSGTTDRAAAEQIKRHIEAEVAKRVAGVIDPRQESFAIHATKPLSEHLDAYEASLECQASAEHIQRQRKRIDRTIEYCGWSILRDLEPDGMNRFASHLRESDKSPTTIGHYITAVKGFVTWAHKSGRLQYDVMATVKKPSQKLGRRVNRRALSIEELQWLFSTTEVGPTRYGMSGRERALVYRVAVMTGLRAGELGQLTRGSFRLTDASPHIVIRGDQSKNKKTAYQPVALDLVPMLVDHLSTKSKEAQVFGLREYDTAKMVRADLAAARAAWLSTFRDPQERIEAESSSFLSGLDEAGKRVDFHALRHTSITLYSSVADPKVTQELARHGDSRTTFNNYVHARSDAKQNAVERIAGMISGPDVQRATGTIDTAPQHPQQNQQQSPRFSLQFAATNCDEVVAELGTEKGIESPKKMGGSAENPGEDGTICDSYGTVAQRLEQGTHNPLQSQQNTAPDAYPQHFQQQSFQKTPVSEADSTTNKLASLSSLVHICESLSAKEQEALLQFALSLYRNEVNQ